MTGGPNGEPRKLVLVVVDAMKQSMLERAIAAGRAPTMALVRDRGVYVDDCVAAFPSVTPVCAATITPGVGPDEPRIPSMKRYVDAFPAHDSRTQGAVLRRPVRVAQDRLQGSAGPAGRAGSAHRLRRLL